jgi:hypothetical protein
MCIDLQNLGKSASRHSRRSRRACGGVALVELLAAMGLAGLVLAVVMALMLFSARSFAALINYADLDNFSRAALDEMTMEIRQADQLVSGSATSMRLRYSNPTNSAQIWDVDYVYNPDNGLLVRLQGNDRRVLLEECSFLEFTFFKRNPVPGSSELYETAPFPLVSPPECKAVQMRWVCSRDIMQQAVNTESVQSARVIIRKK